MAAQFWKGPEHLCPAEMPEALASRLSKVTKDQEEKAILRPEARAGQTLGPGGRQSGEAHSSPQPSAYLWVRHPWQGWGSCHRCLVLNSSVDCDM